MEMSKRYICTKSFYIDKCDDDGFHTEKNMLIREGSLWEESQDSTSVTGAEIHLDKVFKSPKAKSWVWIEISPGMLSNYFQPIQDYEDNFTRVGSPGKARV